MASLNVLEPELTAAVERAARAQRAVDREHARLGLRPARVGRPASYKPEFVKMARHLCKLGATDAELPDGSR
jgi:hypothetical protein